MRKKRDRKNKTNRLSKKTLLYLKNLSDKQVKAILNNVTAFLVVKK